MEGVGCLISDGGWGTGRLSPVEIQEVMHLCQALIIKNLEWSLKYNKSIEKSETKKALNVAGFHFLSQ